MIVEKPDATRAHVPADQKRFDWPVAFAAESFLRDRVDSFLMRNSFARQLAGKMRDETATAFFEWIDYLKLSSDDEVALRQSGFVTDPVPTEPGETALHQPDTTLPRVVIDPRAAAQTPTRLALRPEFLADFVRQLGIATRIEGDAGRRFRRVTVSQENGTCLEAIERHAYRGFVSSPTAAGDAASIEKARDLWRGRRREFTADREGFEEANGLLDQVFT